jgi:hypothetical protein
MSLTLRITVTKATKPEQVKKKDGTVVMNKKNVAMIKSVIVGNYMDGEYQKSVAFECLEQTATTASSIPVGTTLDVNFNIESREWEGRYFTAAKVWKFENIEKPEGVDVNAGKVNAHSEFIPPADDEVNDLPF